jgi:hypothetical protein
MNRKPIDNPQVDAVFDAYPEMTKAKLLFLRQLIFEVAAETDGVGELEETLKWQQPSYLTATSKSGSTIRIDQVDAEEGQYAMYFNCNTTLLDTFRQRYPDEFEYQGDRAIVFDASDDIPVDELKECIALALTYHLTKKGKRS